MADDLITPSQLGLSINTTDIVLYDGATLTTISPGSSPSLNAIILATDSELTSINVAIAGLTAHTSISSGITTYDGTKIFPNFTLVGTSLNDVFAEVSTLVSTNISDIASLDTTDIATGAATPPMNADPYTVGPVVSNVDEALIATDAVIQTFNTGKIDLLESTEITNSGFSSHITTGSNVSIGAGAFDVDIPVLSFYFSPISTLLSGGLVEDVPGVTIVVPASRDNYIDINLATTIYALISVANGAPEPAVPSDHVRVTKAITDGSGITSIVNSFADRQSISGEDNVKRESIGTTQMADGAITDPKLAVSGASPGTFAFANVTITDKGIATAVSSEVTFTSLANEEFLQFDSGSSKWVNVPLVGSILPAGASNGDVLTFNTGSGDWEAAASIAFTAIPLGGTTAPITGDLEFGTGIKIFRSTSSLTLNTNDVTIDGDNFNVTSTNSLIDAETTFTANVILTESVLPTPFTNGVALFAADRASIAGTSGLNIVTEDDTKHIFSDIVGIGTLTPDPSAAMEVTSTTGGFRVPRMTTVERDAISAPATGLIIFNITTDQFNGRNATSWIIMG